MGELLVAVVYDARVHGDRARDVDRCDLGGGHKSANQLRNEDKCSMCCRWYENLLGEQS